MVQLLYILDLLGEFLGPDHNQGPLSSNAQIVWKPAARVILYCPSSTALLGGLSSIFFSGFWRSSDPWLSMHPGSSSA